MDKLPFSVYDFFGYLASGFLLLMTVDYMAAGEWIMREHQNMVLAIFWIILSYITGQILAGPSAWLLERNIVGKWLKRPNVNLFQDQPSSWWVRFFPGYFTPLPKTTRERVMEKAREAGVTETGEGLFVLAFGKVKMDKEAMARLNTFLNLYGFCRNIAFTSALCCVVILVGSWETGLSGHLTWILVALGCALGMFYRYLKFFRQYSYELFITYAALPPEAQNHGS